MDNEIFGYKFQDAALLQNALTHPSVRSKVNYEKLEFLGDRILGAVIAEYLYKTYPAENEGDLAKRQTAFINGEILADIAREYKLNDRIILGSGERKIGGMDKSSNLEDCLEAIIGAVYLDGGGKASKDMILAMWARRFKDQSKPPESPKSRLQEILQEKGLDLPEYEMLSQAGPDHSPIFTMRLAIPGYPEVRLDGKSKKLTERKLAIEMLKNIEEQK